MAIHLVGETIDAKQAHARAQAGDLVQLVRGVYVDQDELVDESVMAHAIRIARYLYPRAYLSGASAALLAPTPDGRLFISGRRNQRTRLRALEIVQNLAPTHPSTETAVVGDDLGELHVAVSSPRQRFLEAFRVRSEHASAISAEMRIQLANRLVEEYGGENAAADAVWGLARENGWYREGEGAERFLLSGPRAMRAPANRAALDLLVAWHGEPLGRLIHDGFEWRWRPRRQAGPVLVRETTPGKLPPFIESLLPEGWLAQVLHERDERESLRRGRRYMSNITIVEDPKEAATLSEDRLHYPLADFHEAGRFTGAYAGPGRDSLEAPFEQKLAQIFSHAETPRLSGVQIKAPMSLAANGALVPATERPFTHILKPAGSTGFEALAAVEWLCLELGRASGFDVPDAALVEMPDGVAPSLIVERFDIRRGPQDDRRLAMEDFCSILDLPSSAKYDATIERVAKALRALSSEPEADLELLFRRAVFAWLIADGDMHLKNLAVLKTAGVDARAFSDVRLAPLYDAVSTGVFPGLGHDRMALKVNGKDERLKKQDFLAMARTIGLATSVAEASMDSLVKKLTERVMTLRLPAFAREQPAIKAMEAQVMRIVEERCAAWSVR